MFADVLQTRKQVFMTKHLKNALIVLQLDGIFGENGMKFCMAIYGIMTSRS